MLFVLLGESDLVVPATEKVSDDQGDFTSSRVGDDDVTRQLRDRGRTMRAGLPGSLRSRWRMPRWGPSGAGRRPSHWEA